MRKHSALASGWLQGDDVSSTEQFFATLGLEIGPLGHSQKYTKNIPNEHVEITEYPNYDLFQGPKWPRNWPSEADIEHTSKSNFNWNVNQDWCETSGDVLSKWPDLFLK